MLDIENIYEDLLNAQNRLSALNIEKKELESKIQKLKTLLKNSNNKLSQNAKFTEDKKIQIFASIFKGRSDVVPKRFESKKTGKSGYQPICSNEWVYGLCQKPKVKCSNCSNRKFVHLSSQLIRQHLLGIDERNRDFVLGIYPLLENENCWFLATDFDKSSWQKDVLAFYKTCIKLNIPAYIERSRSGNGAHVWIFFSEPTPARSARQMGSYIITEAMENYPELGFDSYDRLFPNQDILPKGGFGNLIALPLQAIPRKLDNSVFVDENLIAFTDQWNFLNSIVKMDLLQVSFIANNASKSGRITGVRIIPDEELNPWEQSPSRKIIPKITKNNIPEKLDIVIGNQIYFSKKQLTPQFRNRLIRLAAFQNPEFYRNQAMRLPVSRIPRIISCSEDFEDYIGIPRGCADEIATLMKNYKVQFILQDKRNYGLKLQCNFTGILREDQVKSVNHLSPYDIGVLSASTAFGKTVVALMMIAKRKVNTLILVHRVQLIEQWKARIMSFLDIKADQVGVIGGGVNKPKNMIDIATIQSLCKKGEVADIVSNYGFVIFDECHHLSAVSFELVARQCKARYFLGLSATLQRKDGHQPIIFMQCGPVRFKVNDKLEAIKRGFNHLVVVRETGIKLSQELEENKDVQIQGVYSYIANSVERNSFIIKDILHSMKENRSPVVITERKDHLELLYNRLVGSVKNIFVLKGGLRKKELQRIMQEIDAINENEERLILATGKFLGEGFDDSRLDTLFLTMPIAWKGTLSQYAGRLHRNHYRKKEVMIYDYVDCKIPVLNRMFKKRIKGYEAIGYELEYDNIQQQKLKII